MVANINNDDDDDDNNADDDHDALLARLLPGTGLVHVFAVLSHRLRTARLVVLRNRVKTRKGEIMISKTDENKICFVVKRMRMFKDQ